MLVGSPQHRNILSAGVVFKKNEKIKNIFVTDHETMTFNVGKESQNVSNSFKMRIHHKILRIR